MQPNRTFLFVPGNHPRKLEKVFDSGADAVIIDLEDAVAIAEKPATRAIAVEALKKPHKPRGYIRVNALDTEFCFQDFHQIIGPWLDGIVLPKVESATDYLTAEWMLSNLERDHGMPVGSIDLMPIIETAKGLAAAREIANCGKRIKRLSFGAGDYTRDLNLQWTFGEDEIMSARQEIVLASRLANIEPPIDTVFIHIKEHEHLAASAQKGREFGFQGKLCIHPNQVEASHAAYTPAQAEAEWAQKIIDSFAVAEKEGSASIQVDGYFVDYPIVEKAERIVELYQAVYGNQ